MSDVESPRFYWEHPEGRRAAVRDQSFGEEGYFAAVINHGRRLVGGIHFPDDVMPAGLEPRPGRELHPEDESNLYSDTIANILMAARYAGFDAHAVAEKALLHQAWGFEEAFAAACERRARTSPPKEESDDGN